MSNSSDNDELDALVALELAPEDVADLAATPAMLATLDLRVLVAPGMRALEGGRVAQTWAGAMLDVLDADDPRAAAAAGLRAAAVEEFLARSRRVMVAEELRRPPRGRAARRRCAAAKRGGGMSISRTCPRGNRPPVGKP
jgi:hypothetical protein